MELEAAVSPSTCAIMRVKILIIEIHLLGVGGPAVYGGVVTTRGFIEMALIVRVVIIVGLTVIMVIAAQFN